MENTVLSAYVPATDADSLEKRVAKLNKSLARHGVAVEEVSRETIFINDVATLEVGFSIPELDTGYNYVGNVTQKDGVLSLFSYNNVPLKDFKDIRENACSVCGKKHSKRTNMFIFEKDGELVNVGSSCSANYARFNVSAVYKMLFGFLGKNNQESLNENFGESYETFNMKDVILRTMEAYEKSPVYRKKDYYGGDQGTAGDVKIVLDQIEFLTVQGKEIPEVEVDTRLKAKIATKLVDRYFKEIDDNNNFLFTFKETIYQDGEMVSVLPRKALARMVFAIYSAMKQEKQARLAEKNKDLEFVGEVGASLETELSLQELKEFQSNQFSYYGTTSFLAKTLDRDGNHVSFFTSSSKVLDALEGTKGFVKIKGTVKDHKQFGTIPATTLNRVKVVK